MGKKTPGSNETEKHFAGRLLSGLSRPPMGTAGSVAMSEKLLGGSPTCPCPLLQARDVVLAEKELAFGA